jgi:hypothetical protein
MKRAFKDINKHEENRQLRRRIYNSERNLFLKLLRSEKKKSWRNFASEINEEHWGRCFRWIKNGSSVHEAPFVLKKNNGEYTKTLRETL